LKNSSGKNSRELFRQIKKALEGITGAAEEEAFLILEKVGGLSLNDILLEKAVEDSVWKRISYILERRVKKRIPLPYLIGEINFFGRTFLVEEGVFIPRVETEILLEQTLNFLGDRDGFFFFEPGCGCGVLSISILLEKKMSMGVALDCARKPIKVTKKNSEIYGVEDRLKLIQARSIKVLGGKEIFDFIICNPPYVREEEYKELPYEVKKEPKEALLFKEGGLLDEIIEESRRLLKEGGFLIFEISPFIKETVEEKMRSNGWRYEIGKDFSGAERYVFAKRG